MPSSGSGTGTPITGSLPSGYTPRALQHTLLSLGKYARVLSLNPVHFNQGYSQTKFPLNRNCSDVWYKYSWQKNDVVSREELARAIREAETEIANVMGFWPAPNWVEGEEITYEQYHRRESPAWSGLDIAGRPKSMVTRFGNVRAIGRRATALAGSGVGVTYSDEDGDGFSETATISLDISGSAAETVLNKGWPEEYASSKMLKVYFPGLGPHPSWEIRPHISHSYSGTTLTVVFRSWQLIRQDLIDQYPSVDDEPNPIDVSDVSNLVGTVDVYLEYTDKGSVGVQFLWDEDQNCSVCDGAGCPTCNPDTVNGCATIRDGSIGQIAPMPATYDASTDQWTKTRVQVKREPDRVKVWYLSGVVSSDYERGFGADPLRFRYAQAIAWLATARLDDEICACGNSAAIAKSLREPYVIQSGQGTFLLPVEEATTNPFGLRTGEILAWRNITALNREGQSLTGAAL